MIGEPVCWREGAGCVLEEQFSASSVKGNECLSCEGVGPPTPEPMRRRRILRWHVLGETLTWDSSRGPWGSLWCNGFASPVRYSAIFVIHSFITVFTVCGSSSRTGSGLVPTITSIHPECILPHTCQSRPAQTAENSLRALYGKLEPSPGTVELPLTKYKRRPCMDPQT